MSSIFVISEKEKRDTYEGLLQQQLSDVSFAENMAEADCVVVVGENAVNNHSEQIRLAQRFNMSITYTGEQCRLGNGIKAILQSKHNADREHKHEIGYER